MSAPKMHQKQTGFTLVELLIVVIILAILAAIVVPQFSSATTDAQEGALDSNLSTIRAAIELYKVQHGNAYPGTVATNAGTGCAATGAVKGTATAAGSQALIDHLLMASDATGNTCNLSDATYRFGPYLRKGVPTDGITGKGAVAADIVVSTGGTPIVPTVTTGGWAYDSKSGQFVMNSTADDGKSKPYYTH